MIVLCNRCGRERTPQDRDYDPLKAVLSGLVGWYSGDDDGQICPEDMTALMRTGNPSYSYRPDVAARP